ncbi:hypothetical protein CDAR_424441 [Caerostris darwini]|uniref:Uncharacterized protein n=1 Tax=Caerostris darwini TaxID=1538125 RepID=A0AAV4T4Q0_9ARAC|nr:hypothetical protein CDAR_424441 [Caerostris darwini]
MTPDRSPPNTSHVTSYSEDLSWEDSCPETLTKWRKIPSTGYIEGFVRNDFPSFTSLLSSAEADSVGGKVGNRQEQTSMTPDRSPLNASHATSYSRDLFWEDKCPET